MDEAMKELVEQLQGLQAEMRQAQTQQQQPPQQQTDWMGLIQAMQAMQKMQPATASQQREPVRHDEVDKRLDQMARDIDEIKRMQQSILQALAQAGARAVVDGDNGRTRTATPA